MSGPMMDDELDERGIIIDTITEQLMSKVAPE